MNLQTAEDERKLGLAETASAGASTIADVTPLVRLRWGLTLIRDTPYLTMTLNDAPSFFMPIEVAANIERDLGQILKGLEESGVVPRP